MFKFVDSFGAVFLTHGRYHEPAVAWGRAFSTELFPRLQALKLQGSITAMYALS